MSWFSNLGHDIGSFASNPLVDAGLSLIPGVGPGLALGAHVLGGALSGGNVQNGMGGNFGQNNTGNSASGLDANSQQQLKNIQNAYGQAGAAGPGPLLNGAAGYGTNAQAFGNLGFGALGGNPSAVNQLMNPYIQNVMGANQQQAAKAQQLGTNQLNAQATAAGAFGGSRAGVAQGVMMANNQQNLANQNASLLAGGYGQAMNQAAQLGQFGMQGAQMNSNLGFGGVGNPALWNAQQLRNGFVMPTGQTGSFNQNQNNGLASTAQGIGNILSLFQNPGSGNNGNNGSNGSGGFFNPPTPTFTTNWSLNN